MASNMAGTSKVYYCAEDRAFVFLCPHCNLTVQVSQDETRCCIFRHGMYTATQAQMDPHTPKDACDRAAALGLIVGCGKPFRFVYVKPLPHFEGHVEICGYI